MPITTKDLKTSIAVWKQRNGVNDHRWLVLKIKGTNIEIGNAIQFTATSEVRVVSRLSNIGGMVKMIPPTSTLEDIHAAWEEVMNQLLATISA